MTTEERDQIFRRCICTYGTNPQIDVAIEEMSELIKALLKWRRAGGAGMTEAREKRIDYKVRRQEERLGKSRVITDILQEAEHGEKE